VDDFKAQVKELKKREKALLAIKNKRLAPLREECLKLRKEDIKNRSEASELIIGLSFWHFNKD
jgi:hypothetical protein